MELLARRPLRPCPNCSQHIKAAEPSCPHCGAQLGERGLTSATLILPIALGLALAGCNKNEPSTTPPADPATVGDDAGAGDAGGDDGDTMADPGGDPIGDDIGEPEYGVPVSDDDGGPAPEPEYGVPETF